MEQLWADLGVNGRLAIFALLILANVVVGAASALKDGKFTAQELAGIFDLNLIKYAAGFAGSNIVGSNIDGTAGAIVANGGSLVAAAPFITSTYKYLVKLVTGK